MISLKQTRNSGRRPCYLSTADQHKGTSLARRDTEPACYETCFELTAPAQGHSLELTLLVLFFLGQVHEASNPSPSFMTLDLDIGSCDDTH